MTNIVCGFDCAMCPRRLFELVDGNVPQPNWRSAKNCPANVVYHKEMSENRFY